MMFGFSLWLFISTCVIQIGKTYSIIQRQQITIEFVGVESIYNAINLDVVSFLWFLANLRVSINVLLVCINKIIFILKKSKKIILIYINLFIFKYD